jgi:hypothetical protein
MITKKKTEFLDNVYLFLYMTKLKQNQFILSGNLITERPILFQTEMVRANLEDRKTQTRRGFNQPSYLTNKNQRFLRMGFVNGKQYAAAIGSENFSTLFKTKHGKPGDLLWVSEKHTKIEARYYYFADLEDPEDFEEIHHVYGLTKIKWKPSIHMPKAAARLWLMVEDIRPERLQDISKEDAIAEGVESWIETRLKSQPVRYKVYGNSYPEDVYTSCPISSFETLITSINGKDFWKSNPWVWVIKYRILSKTGRPSDDIILDNFREITEKLVTGV